MDCNAGCVLRLGRLWTAERVPMETTAWLWSSGRSAIYALKEVVADRLPMQHPVGAEGTSITASHLPCVLSGTALSTSFG